MKAPENYTLGEVRDMIASKKVIARADVLNLLFDITCTNKAGDVKAEVKELLQVYHIGDCIYDVRERVCEDEEDTTDQLSVSNWEHPKVKRFAEIVEILEAWVKE